MKKKSFPNSLLAGLSLIAMAIIFEPASIFATMHVVAFGGSHGMSYSPATFMATVGDSVRWEGSFSAHPLSSTTIPTNAAKWHQATGSTFTYVIKVAGEFKYQCDLHIAQGMIASFSVSEPQVSNQNTLKDNKISSTVMSAKINSGTLYVRVNLEKPQLGSIKLFDISGREVVTLMSGILAAGNHEVSLGDKVLKAGNYFVEMKSGTYSQVIRFTKTT